MALPAIPLTIARGSRYGADGICYPAEEERAVPLSEQAMRLIAYLYHALRHVFQDRDDVHVGADQFIYWEAGNVQKKIAPDGFVIQGVPREPPRAVIRLWEEAVPDLVIEVSSEGSRADDRGPKLQTYQSVLKCPEYLIYDEDLDEILFYELLDGHYRLQSPSPDGRFHSRRTGASFARDREILLRVFDLNGLPVPEAEEWVELYRAAQQAMERERERAEREWRRAEREGRRAARERQRADAADLRARQLEEELNRLRALLDGTERS